MQQSTRHIVDLQAAQRHAQWIMKSIVFTVIVSIFLIETCVAQVALLGEYDFQNHPYTILLVSQSSGMGEHINPPVYIEATNIQDSLKAKLVFTEEAPIYRFACWQNEAFLVCENGQLRESLSISRNCKSISSNEGEFEYFETLILDSCKKAFHQHHTFASLEIARAYVENARNSPDIILVENEEWMLHEGYFYFTFKTKAGENLFIESELRMKIAEDFPDEPYEFELHCTSGSSETGFNYRATMKCNKTLFDQFKLYPPTAAGWQPFPLELETYWKKPPRKK